MVKFRCQDKDRTVQTYWLENNVWYTKQHKQGIQEVELDHFLDVCYKRIRGMVDGINVHTESSAGHNIHTIRSKYSVKRQKVKFQLTIKIPLSKRLYEDDEEFCLTLISSNITHSLTSMTASASTCLLRLLIRLLECFSIIVYICPKVNNENIISLNIYIHTDTDSIQISNSFGVNLWIMHKNQ